MVDVARLNIVVDASEAKSGSRQVNESLKSVEKQVARTEKQFTGFGGNVRGVFNKMSTGARSAFGKVGASAKGLFSELVTLRGAFGALAAGAVVRDIVQTTAAFETLERTLKLATGSTAAAAQEMSFLRAEADRLGLDLLSVGQEYAKMSVAAREAGVSQADVKDLFIGISETAKVMALDVNTTNGVFLALTQIMSKGKVTAEELRGQLGERLPQALGLMAKALDTDVQALDKMLERGEIGVDVLGDFGRAASAAAANELPSSLSTVTSEMARLDNAMNQLKNEIGRELNPALSTMVSLLTDALAQSRKLGSAAFDLFGTSRDDTLRDAIAQVDAQIAAVTRNFEAGGIPIETYEIQMAGLREEAKVLQEQLQGVMGVVQEMPAEVGTTVAEVAAPTAGPDISGQTDQQRDSVEKMIGALEQQAKVLGFTNKELELYKLKSAGAIPEQLKLASSIIDTIEASERQVEADRLASQAIEEETQAVQGLVSELEPLSVLTKEYEENQRLLNVARDRGIVDDYTAANALLTDEYERQRDELTGVAEEERKLQEARAEAQSIVQQEDPLARFESQIEKRIALQETLRQADSEGNAELIAGLEKSKAAIEEQALAFVNAGEKSEEGFNAMNEFATAAARNMQSTFSNELFNVLDGNFEGMADRFNEMLLKMAADLVASQLLSSIEGLNFGGATPGTAPAGTAGAPSSGGFDFTSILGGIVPSLFGAANGLDFTVPGAGGVDSQTVAFKATPGARVVEIPPGGRDSNAGNVGQRTVNVTMNLTGVKDAQTFAKNKPQIINRLQRELEEAGRNM